MEPSFWITRWQEGRIGFHEGHVNRLLERYAPRLHGRARVLVPLCGKAEDMAHLASLGHEVVGVDLAEEAAVAFFAEHQMQPTRTAHGPFVSFAAPGVTILVGDFFALTPELLGPVHAFFDRAALIALPPPMRARYVAHLRTLLPPASLGLLVVLEYDQAVMDGPPFAVLEPEVRAHWQGATVTSLEEEEAHAARLAELNATAKNRVYEISGLSGP